MTDRTTIYVITTVAGTLPTAPHIVDVRLGLSTVRSVLIDVPPGPSGLVGFSLWSGGSQVYPLASGQWFVFDDYKYLQEVSRQVNSGQWQIQTYNTDTIDHVLRFYFNWDLIEFAPTLSPFQPLSL